MKTEFKITNDVTVVSFTGPIEFGEARRFADEVRTLLDEGRRRFVLDFRGLAYIESTLIAATVASLKRVRQRSGTLRIVLTPRSMVEHVLEITALTRILDVFHDLPSALE